MEVCIDPQYLAQTHDTNQPPQFKAIQDRQTFTNESLISPQLTTTFYMQQDTNAAHPSPKQVSSSPSSTERKHTCTLCLKSFKGHGALSNHLLTHSERTFKCMYCNKAFRMKHHLNRHIGTLHKKVLVRDGKR
ncbi:unnamed protein product [Owenia fusiformis]|uniref:Uncharacterized protein n=1 Tax=Owenia fusiformis TaxID=6347 RepID=A0A8J1TJL1_OWEFU|nr:unnamed protein product [Owenia fusiformis]